MKTDYEVPFYSNTPDDTHCMQASYRMVLKYFEPKKNFSWNELDRITAKQKDMWTWPMAGLCWFVKQGYEVVYIEDFDYRAFSAQKEKYLFSRYGDQLAKEQIKHSKISEELKWVSIFLDTVNVQNRIPVIDEIKNFLCSGYLVVVSVNYRSLHNKDGYVGHAVVVKGFKKGGIILHDPGSPGLENFEVSFEQFSKGWSYPTHRENNITAIKKKSL
jgi:hypothetical protein